MSKIKKIIKILFSSSKKKIKKDGYSSQNISIRDSLVGEYSYISKNSIIHNTTIGKFCSIGPNVVCGFGDHPTNRLSSSPAFYSTKTEFDLKPKEDLFFGGSKVEIGNDVWIGANVFIKNGITIGSGAIIGAGAVVLKDVPPYAIVVGVPAKVKSYRFDSTVIEKLLQIEWWNFSIETIRNHFDVLSSEDIINNLDTLLQIKKESNGE